MEDVVTIILAFSFVTETLVQCNDDEFKCNKGKCIPKAYRCDSDNDCEDNSDEEPYVDCPNLECEPNEFKCSEVGSHRRRCIPLVSVQLIGFKFQNKAFFKLT